MTNTNVYVEMDKLTKEQWEDCINHPAYKAGALMPDAHAGYDAPIGAVIGLKDWVVPSWVGYDIGCGMCAVKTCLTYDQVKDKLKEIQKKIHKYVPTGEKDHGKAIYDLKIHRGSEAIREAMDKRRVEQQLGTLGSGNHFLELNIDEDNNVWIVVHSGSRGFGHQVATYWMKKQEELGQRGFYLHSEEGQQYVADMNECLRYALISRRLMLSRAEMAITKVVYGEYHNIYSEDDMINRNHNHMDIAHDMCIHRKGATHSEEGMLGVIPGNMRDGSYIVKGTGKAESLWSSSHGAGRKYSRTQARKLLNVDEFKEQMKDIPSDAGNRTLDEAPEAYKNIAEVIETQVNEGILEVLHVLKPIVNVKGAK